MDKLNSIAESNLALMLGDEKGGMRHLLLGESIGGTAGPMHSGANFICDREGRIVYFGNYSEGEFYRGMDAEKRRQYFEAIFRARVMLGKNPRRISWALVELLFYGRKPSAEAIQNIIEAANAFNKQCGFSGSISISSRDSIS